jgi:hypothetical protein
MEVHGGGRGSSTSGIYAAGRRAAAALSLCLLAGALLIVVRSRGPTVGLVQSNAPDQRSAPDYVEIQMPILDVSKHTGRHTGSQGGLRATTLELVKSKPAAVSAYEQERKSLLAADDKKASVGHVYRQLLKDVPQREHVCTETGKHCCAADAPLTCCCSLFKEEHMSKKEILNTTHVIPQKEHNCTDFGKHCCVADAPFECCCVLTAWGKPLAHNARSEAAKVGQKLTKIAKTFSGNTKTPVATPVKAPVHSTPHRTDSMIENEASAELKKIKAFELDFTGKKPAHDPSTRLKADVKGRKNGSQAAARVNEGTSQVAAGSKVHANKQHDAVGSVSDPKMARREVETEQSAGKREAAPQKNHESNKKDSMSASSDGSRRVVKPKIIQTLANRIIEEAQQEARLDRDLIDGWNHAGPERPLEPAVSQSELDHAGHTKDALPLESDHVRSPSDAAARSWKPPSFSFANLKSMSVDISNLIPNSNSL